MSIKLVDDSDSDGNSDLDERARLPIRHDGTADVRVTADVETRRERVGWARP